MASSWQSQLQAALSKKFSSTDAARLYKKYQTAFSNNYCNDCPVANTLQDIQHLESLSSNNTSKLDFYEAKDDTGSHLHLRLYQYGEAYALSDLMPILENMDLRIYDERLYEVKLASETRWISDFIITYPNREGFNIEQVEDIFQEAFTRVCAGVLENDGFNKLVLAAGLNWQQITVLRMYAKYLQQLRFLFSQPYIEKTMVQYPTLTQDLVTLFETIFNPKSKGKDKAEIEKLNQRIEQSLGAIVSLDEDRIMRRFWELIKATLRTNYFQRADNQPKPYLAIKLKSGAIPELPLPHPLYEIFVYSPRFEAIHLRSAKVSRGGIRWSDRREDFRTEILGLMKAQKVKNAVIVPAGAKGGFVLKAVPAKADRKMLQAEVLACYKLFIQSLLDITDNIRADKVVRPLATVCLDDEDPYLVVAADKGTASFSDVANQISKEHDFWLGDAFASGGSAGYDHKKIGITARGAWESIKRHFFELNLDWQANTITVIGIGDMSGDVFGNGMIYSDRIKLVAAFDHRHIFLDPDPNPAESYKERKRMFNLPTSSWADYNPQLISKGGGVFPRSAKTITLTAEVKKILDTTQTNLTPSELIKVLLQAPVDLLYNGGIGTYVKASNESNADVGDKTNDACRINGNQLRVKVVGEGGNLGFTQLGRIEYALQGGLINTDFIDNSAGVDTSDHEVNIKILLNKVVAKGDLTEKKRNQLLVKMQDDVVGLVLKDNFEQALALSYSAQSAARYITLYQEYLKELETLQLVDRAVEFLPNDKTLLERKAAGLGLTRPELAVLLSYTKIHLKNEILQSDLPEDRYFFTVLEQSFPALLVKQYKNAIIDHSLHREIIATQLSNQIVNEMGITFVYRIQSETGATVAEIVRAHTVSACIFEASEVKKLLDSLSNKISSTLQNELLHYLRNLLNIATRWFLSKHLEKHDLEKTINHYTIRIKKLAPLIPQLISGVTKEYLSSVIDHFVQAGFPAEVANKVAIYRAMYTTLNIIDVSTIHKFDLMKTAYVYFNVGVRFNLLWFRDQILNDSREGHWNALARLVLRDELDSLQRLLTITIIRSNQKESDAEKLIEQWAKGNQRAMQRWEQVLQMLHGTPDIDYTVFFIVLRELANRFHVHV